MVVMAPNSGFGLVAGLARSMGMMAQWRSEGGGGGGIINSSLEAEAAAPLLAGWRYLVMMVSLEVNYGRKVEGDWSRCFVLSGLSR